MPPVQTYNHPYHVSPTKHRGQGNRGGRRPKEEEDNSLMTPEEYEKRRLRRLRNKEAAARCRQRRLDHMDALQKQVDALQAENRQKEADIDRLRNEKQELERLLRTHQPCKLGGACQGAINGFASSPAVKILRKNSQSAAAAAAGHGVSAIQTNIPGLNRLIKAEEPTLTQVATATVAQMPVMSEPMTSMGEGAEFIQRPTTLQFPSSGGAVPPTPGVQISTPSSGLLSQPFDLLSGPTGLTPVNNTGLTPMISLASAISQHTPGASLETPIDVKNNLHNL